MKPLSPQAREYIRSEEHIHDYLVDSCDTMVKKLRSQFHEGTKLTPILIFWPEETIKSDEGTAITNMVLMDVADPELMTKHAKEGVKLTKAYAAAGFIIGKKSMKMVLETKYGKTESWLMHRQWRGDRYILTEPMRLTDRDQLGVWT